LADDQPLFQTQILLHPYLHKETFICMRKQSAMPIMPDMSHTLNFLMARQIFCPPSPVNSKKLSQFLLPTQFCPFVNVTEYLLLNVSFPILCFCCSVYQDLFCHKSTVILCSFNLRTFSIRNRTYFKIAYLILQEIQRIILKNPLNTRQNACACP